MQTPDIVGIKQLRSNLNHYIDQVKKGQSFTVIKRSKAVFKITPVSLAEPEWEEAVDFTKLKKGGIAISELLTRL